MECVDVTTVDSTRELQLMRISIGPRTSAVHPKVSLVSNQESNLSAT